MLYYFNYFNCFLSPCNKTQELLNEVMNFSHKTSASVNELIANICKIIGRLHILQFFKLSLIFGSKKELWRACLYMEMENNAS